MERMTAAGRLGPPLVFLPGIPAICGLLERSNSKAGMLGLEYIVELVSGSRKYPSIAYKCVLCFKTMSTKGGTMHHIMQNEHKVEFLRRHFPQSIAQVLPFMTHKNSWQFDHPQARFALRHICCSVEERFGRQTPYKIQLDLFERSQAQYQRKIEDGPHFVEDVPVPLDKFNLPNAMNAGHPQQFVDEDDGNNDSAYYDESGMMMNSEMDDGFEKLTRWNEEHTLDAPFIESADIHADKPMINVTVTTNRNNNSFSASTVTVAKSVLLSENEPSTKPLKKPVIGSTSPTPSVGNKSISISPEVYDIYKRQLDKVSVELQAQLLKFETEPENHPLYPTEWKAFWARRSAELQEEGKDTSTYDFSAEWTRFWLVRVHELNDEELERADRRIRREFDLPLDGPIIEPTALSLAGKTQNHEEAVSAVPLERSQSRDRRIRAAESLSAKQARFTQSPERRRNDRSFEHTTSGINKDCSRSDRERSPLERSSSQNTDRLRRNDEALRNTSHRFVTTTSRSATGATMMASNKTSRFGNTLEPLSDDEMPQSARDLDGDLEQDVTEPVTVISVLRLLSAFEDLLGSSLGPRVVDLLSKAVALEKVKANLADDLLMSAENSVLLDTVKEKLKGLLLAGVVERFKIKSVRKVIAHVNSITSIIDKQTKLKEEQNMAEARVNLVRLKEQERLEEELRKQREAEQKKRDDAESRALVTKQLATSITLQGKLITTEQLEALTDVYINNHSAEDTPYLFGLQMGSRFPDLKEDSSQGEMTSQESQSGNFPDQHPMHWNAHHQPPIAEQMQQQTNNHYREQQYGMEQQQQQSYNSYGYYNQHQMQQSQTGMQSQHDYQQQSSPQKNPFRSKSDVRPNHTASSSNDRQQQRDNRGSAGGRAQQQISQSSTTSSSSYERNVTMPLQQPHQQQQQPQKSSKSVGSNRSRTQGYSGHGAGRSNLY